MIPRFMSFMDAVLWADEKLHARRCAGGYCDLDAPCRRHDRTHALGRRLWYRQLAREVTA